MEVLDLQETVSQLIADINEHDRLVEYDFALDASLNTLELLDRKVYFAAVEVAFCKAGSSLDIVIDSEFKCWII